MTDFNNTSNSKQECCNFLKDNRYNGIMGTFMHINIFINDLNDPKLKTLYLSAAEAHNKKIQEDIYYDAGFDLFLPNDTIRFIKKSVNKVDFKVKCSATIHHNEPYSATRRFTPFYTYARSSLSKTPLRLANNQGIIDAGYRGNLIGMFDCIENNSDLSQVWNMEPYSRVLQICAPGLIPIYVTIVDTIEELGPSTLRGEGGFGSTGK